MINKFYTIDNGLDEVNCFSIDEIYIRLIAARLPMSKAVSIRELVSTMKPDDFLVFNDFKAGRIVIRCWNYTY